MKLLVIGERSGVVRNAFSSRGHYAVSCDLVGSDLPGKHYIADAFEMVRFNWDIIIAHPPCTYLANSGVKHLYTDPKRIYLMLQARQFFMALWRLPVKKLCLENPVPHHFAELPAYSQIINPYDFGHPVSKRTCLYLRGLPPLLPTFCGYKSDRYCKPSGKTNGSTWYNNPPGKGSLSVRRSRTFEGVALAMANQWGCLVKP